MIYFAAYLSPICLIQPTPQILSDKNISIHRKYIGEYATSLEMAGMSISLLKLDDELKEMIDAPCYSPFFEQNH